MSMLGEVEVQVLGGDVSRGVMEVQEGEVEIQEDGGLARDQGSGAAVGCPLLLDLLSALSQWVWLQNGLRYKSIDYFKVSLQSRSWANLKGKANVTRSISLASTLPPPTSSLSFDTFLMMLTMMYLVIMIMMLFMNFWC